jgi:hypothetical protein
MDEKTPIERYKESLILFSNFLYAESKRLAKENK